MIRIQLDQQYGCNVFRFILNCVNLASLFCLKVFDSGQSTFVLLGFQCPSCSWISNQSFNVNFHKNKRYAPCLINHSCSVFLRDYFDSLIRAYVRTIIKDPTSHKHTIVKSASLRDWTKFCV